MPQSIILLSDVPGLGQIGDVRRVKDGYARNYLIPERLAVPATSESIKRFEKQKEKLAAQREKQLSNAQDFSKKIEKVGLVFERPVGEGGRMFGSVTPLDIVTELAKQGVTIEKRFVLMNGPIKSVGDHNVRVRLHSQVIVEVPVKVIGKEIKRDSEPLEVETTEKK